MFLLIAGDNHAPLLNRIDTQPYIENSSPLSSPNHPTSSIMPLTHRNSSPNEQQLPNTARGVIAQQEQPTNNVRQAPINVHQTSVRKYCLIVCCAVVICSGVIYGLVVLIQHFSWK